MTTACAPDAWPTSTTRSQRTPPSGRTMAPRRSGTRSSPTRCSCSTRPSAARTPAGPVPSWRRSDEAATRRLLDPRVLHGPRGGQGRAPDPAPAGGLGPGGGRGRRLDSALADDPVGLAVPPLVVHPRPARGRSGPRPGRPAVRREMARALSDYPELARYMDGPGRDPRDVHRIATSAPPRRGPRPGGATSGPG